MSMNFEDIKAFSFVNEDVEWFDVGVVCRTTSYKSYQVAVSHVSVEHLQAVIYSGTNLNPKYPSGSMLAVGNIYKSLMSKEVYEVWTLAFDIATNDYYIFPLADMIEGE